MNKKVNTALFIIGATIVNLVLMAVILLIGFVILSLLPINNASGIGTILVILVFFAAIVGTFVIYHNMVKYLSTKIDMDKYFHPIIKRKEDK